MVRKKKTFYLKTFGCQANVADSQRIAQAFVNNGYQPTKDVQSATVVIINSCLVRQSAENRIWGLINNLKKLKPNRKIILTGCLAGCIGQKRLSQQAKNLFQKRVGKGVEIIPTKELASFAIPPLRTKNDFALIPISQGCNHFCSYCIVPYARGLEKSRPFEEIIKEAQEAVNQGFKKILLIGQNVNSYGKDLKTSNIKHQTANIHTPFALLLAILHKIPDIEKISFLTSNPWDLTDDIVEAMSLPKIDRYLHLPVQSGDDGILRKMNRPYTAKQYLNLVKKIRQRIPEIKIGTDIIVGFPGESKRAFENTVKLCRQVGFEKAYIAKYSPRPGTAAFRLKDDISPEEKKRRWKILEELINKKNGAYT